VTVIARKVRSTPERNTTETWDVIVDLLAPDASSVAAAELRRVSGIAGALICSEAMGADPAVATGSGPRVRIYCLHGEEAIDGEDANEKPLAQCPTDGDWGLSLPCPEEDLPWISAELSRLSERVRARAIGEPVETASPNTRGGSGAVVDKKAFFRS